MKTAPGIDERYRPATDTEIVLQFRDQGPDEMGRRRFIAHRLDYGPLGDHGHRGHRGQVFHTHPAKFTADAAKRGMTVRTPGQGGPP